MTTIQIFDPAWCCSAGVCGTVGVDKLLDMASGRN